MNVFKIALTAATLAGASLLANAASATTIDFEGLADRSVVTTQYAAQGVVFSGATLLQAPNYNTYYYPAHSGSNVVFDSGSQITLTFSSLVDSVSAYYSTPFDLTLSAFDSKGVLIGTTAGATNYAKSSLISFAGAGIASATFSVGRVDYLTLDDVSFSPSAVPEPATWAMMLAGFGMIGFAARRRVSAKTALRLA